jgi:replication-associated recombination protein RarA
MVVIILEGIATTGKSTLTRILSRLALKKGVNLGIVGEDKTLLPVLGQKLKLRNRVAHVRRIVDSIRLMKPTPSILIVDRLMLTHAVIGKTSLRPYVRIEKALRSVSASIVLLTIPKQKIRSRVTWALKHRDSKWKKHALAKGSIASIVKYYRAQQSQLLRLADHATLPVHVVDTGNRDFPKIAIRLFRMATRDLNVKSSTRRRVTRRPRKQLLKEALPVASRKKEGGHVTELLYR